MSRRERKKSIREARRMREQGKSCAEIGKAFNRHPATIRTWLKQSPRRANPIIAASRRKSPSLIASIIAVAQMPIPEEARIAAIRAMI